MQYIIYIYTYYIYIYGATLHQLYTSMFQIPVARILNSEAKFSFVLREARGSPGCVGSHGVLGRAPPHGLGREKHVESAANCWENAVMCRIRWTVFTNLPHSQFSHTL